MQAPLLPPLPLEPLGTIVPWCINGSPLAVWYREVAASSTPGCCVNSRVNSPGSPGNGLERIISADRETFVSRHIGVPIKDLLKPLSSIVLWWFEGFKEDSKLLKSPGQLHAWSLFFVVVFPERSHWQQGRLGYLVAIFLNFWSDFSSRFFEEQKLFCRRVSWMFFIFISFWGF